MDGTVAKKYTQKDKKVWDEFLRTAKNRHFFFYRDYMDYHSDRFKDHSILFYKNDKLCALMPANIDGNILASHGGLTFGGVISNQSMTTLLMLEVFDSLTAYCRKQKIKEINYKAVPFIYHQIPSEEDRYALFKAGAVLYRRDVTTTVFIGDHIKFQSRRKRAIAKAEGSSVTVSESTDFKSFWAILEENLQNKYKLKPVHTLDEITLLKRRFENNIRLFTAAIGKEIVAGTVVYENDKIAHAQYIASSERGGEVSALDLVFGTLINKTYADKLYFDFGVSTEKQGQYLNKGLIEYKEGFGGSTITHDFFRVIL